MCVSSITHLIEVPVITFSICQVCKVRLWNDDNGELFEKLKVLAQV